MPYFDNNFPIIYYDFPNKTLPVVDILRNVSFSRQMRDSAQFYTNYTWQDYDTVELLAERLYGDQYSYWTIDKENDISDPLIELPKSNSVLERWIDASHPGRAWFVSPTEIVDNSTTKRYRPNIYNEGKNINVQGEDVVYGTLKDDNRTSFEFNKGASAGLIDVVPIDISGKSYPTDLTTKKIVTGGVDWYLGSFMPKVGSVIIFAWNMTTTASRQSTGFDALLATGPFIENDAFSTRIAKVTATNLKTGTFSVAPMDSKGSLPKGIDVFNSITLSSRFFCKVVWSGNCYNHNPMLGRLLLKTPTNAPAVSSIKGVGTLTGIPAFIPADLHSGKFSLIRKFYIMKEVSKATNALDYFLDTKANEPGGTSADPILKSGNFSDQISLIGRYVTGFYGGVPAKYVPITIKEHQIDVNELNRNIKVLSQTVNDAAITLFQQEIKK